jgi:putative flippase GtrA
MSFTLASLPKERIFRLAKYAAFGAMAVGVRVGMFFFFSKWWPSDEKMTWLSHHDRAWNNQIANVLAFIFSNGFAYVTNALWVFKGGRHSRRREFVYFTIISLISLTIGSIGGPLMIALFGISDQMALINFILVSMVVNYLGRRYLVFQV